MTSERASGSRASNRPNRHPRHTGASISSVRPSRRDSILSIQGSSNRRIEEEKEVEEPPEIILAINSTSESLLGCAYFSTEDGILNVSDDIPMASMDVAELLLIYAQPTTVLYSSKATLELQEFLESWSTRPLTECVKSTIIHGLQSSEFTYNLGRDRLVNAQCNLSSVNGAIFSIHSDTDVDIRAAGSNTPRESQDFRTLRCGGYINLHNHISVGCASAVLGDIQRRRSSGNPNNGEAGEDLFQLKHFRMFSLSQFMQISYDALFSLQILQTEHHPNSQGLVAPGAKESLSVYGLFHHLACTPQGRIELRRLFVRPMVNAQLIKDRQTAISVLLQPNNSDKLVHITSALRHICNLRRTFSKLRQGTELSTNGKSVQRGVWATIQGFVSQAIDLKELLLSLNDGAQVGVISKLISYLDQIDLLSVGDIIMRTVDLHDSKSRHRTSIRAGLDPALDELKRKYDGMDSLLTNVVKCMKEELPEWAHGYIQSCTFLPEIGFLTVVELDPTTSTGRFEGEGSATGAWQMIFTDNGTACYKNRYMRDLDEKYGDSYNQIGDREVEIIQELTNVIMQHEENLLLASDACGEFDAVAALAQGASKYGWRAPKIVESSLIHIEGGRHPLQELMVPSFIPNDCFLASGREQDRTSGTTAPQVMMLTGPNHSGKSIYLKQVAIIVYLAHIGSFVPVKAATIGLTDKILTCISTPESLSGADSAFAVDLKRATLSMRCSSSRSLVLIDEFGKGTNGDDGIGVATALLDHFLSRGLESPRVIAATHYHEIVERGYLHRYRHRRLLLAHMDVRVDPHPDASEDTVTCLYSLVPGHSTSSFGGRCAAVNGVPDPIVTRAETLSLLLAQNEDLGAICTRLSPADEKRLEEAEAVARTFLSAMSEGAEEEIPGFGRRLLHSLPFSTSGPGERQV